MNVIALALPLLFGSSIDTNLIDQTVKTKQEAIADCYDEGLKRKPKLRGKIVVLFTVENDGRVSDAVIKKGTTLADDDVKSCVLAAMKELTFPPMGGDCDAAKEDCTVRITYPFTFTP
jgi:TonB family protein